MVQGSTFRGKKAKRMAQRAERKACLKAEGLEHSA